MTSRHQCGRCRSTLDVLQAFQIDDPPNGQTSALVRVMIEGKTETIRQWLTDNEQIIGVLKQVLTEGRPLTHSDLDNLDHPFASRHLRRKLETAGLLPARHFELGLFDAWTETFLLTIDRDSDRMIITTYVRWSQRRRLERAIDDETIRDGSFRVARRYIRMATTFLNWLHEQERDLSDCSQRHIDQWFATGNSNRWSALNFLSWTLEQRFLPRTIRLPIWQPPAPKGMPTAERTRIVQRLLHDDTIATADRVAGLLVTVLAQPVSRVCRMRSDAVETTERDTLIELGPKQIELDAGIARVLHTHLNDIAPNPDGWLFPGRTAGRPVSSHGLSERLRPYGVTKEARVSALHDLTRKIEPGVLPDIIGYNPFVVANRSKVLGAAWQHYAALATASPTTSARHPRPTTETQPTV